MPVRRRWHVLNITLRGLPELDLFDSEEKRRAALARIGRDAGNPRGAWFWGAILLLAGSVFAVLRGAAFVLGRAGWPPWATQVTAIAACVVTFALVLRWLHRSGASKELRLQLIEQGVPVCLECGYVLRGLTPAHGRCPECGRGFDAEIIRLLGGTALDLDE